MDKNKIILGSLAMDLKRVAMGYYRKSDKMADRFLDEAIKRKNEIDLATVKPYIKNLLKKLDSIKMENDKQNVAENILMYSTLFQNAAI
jgi:hypothetical protein